MPIPMYAQQAPRYAVFHNDTGRKQFWSVEDNHLHFTVKQFKDSAGAHRLAALLNAQTEEVTP